VPAADDAGFLANATLEAIFAPFATLQRLALAVSGGADSLALLILAQRWRAAMPGRPGLVVLSVDHGLRPESAGELRFVEGVAARYGLPFRGLRWDGPVPAAGIEAAARAARYRRLAETARAEGVTHIATAHHRDDQAETFLMRLARGSGVYGLAAMARETDKAGIRLVRPLLGVAHEDLVAEVRAAGLTPVEDPHNRDPAFDRVRLRALMPALAAEGLDARKLAATAERLGRAAAALDHYVGRLFGRAMEADAFGAVRLQAEAWRDEPEEIRLRSLARILRATGGAAYVPRLESVEALAAAMQAGDTLAARTLAGVVIDRRKGVFRFQREGGRDGLPEIPVESGFDGVWDGRFRVAVAGAPAADLSIGALGEAGRRQFAACVPRGMPRAIEALPVLRRAGTILACPGLGIDPEPAHGIVFSATSLVAARMLDPARHDDPGA
jgi:tRNA(Ile)-lysidine synthase